MWCFLLVFRNVLNTKRYIKSFNNIDKSKWFIQALSVARWELYLALFVSKKQQPVSLRLGATALWEGNIQCFGLH